MKVCFISHSADRGGGAEMCLLELIDALRTRGVNCSCILPGPGPLHDLLADRDVETTVVRFKLWVGHSHSLRKRTWCTLRNLHAVSPMVQAMKRSGCDVVYTNTFASCVGAVAAGIMGLPHIWHFHEFGFDENGTDFDFDLGLRLSMKLINELSAACIANSRAVADAYRPHLPATDLSVVYNSVEVPPLGDDVPVDAPWRHAGAIRCVMLGAIQPRKGQADALRALAELRRLNVPAELLLIGNCNPSYRETIQGMINELKLTDRVHLHGFCAKPLPLVKTADVLLMCTLREAFGRVTVEAMKLGLPVIGTQSGGTPEIVQPGETGYLYTPGNVKELTARIADLYVNPSDRRRMGANARRSAGARFNQEKYGQEVETILRRVVSARSRGADLRTRRAA